MKKVILLIIVVAIGVGGYFTYQNIKPLEAEATLEQMTVKVGQMYNISNTISEGRLDEMSDITYETSSEGIAQIASGNIGGMLMPIHKGTCKITMTATYREKKFKRVLPIKVTEDKNVEVGVDISAWNKNLDIEELKKNHIQFVMLRLGYRKNVDAQSRLLAIKLKKANMPTGAYWYLASHDGVNLMSLTEAKEQARMCVRMLNNMEGKSMSYPIFLDLESSTLINSENPSDYIQKLCKTFTDILNDAGYNQVGIYANKSFLASYINKEYYKSFKIWYARYGYAKKGPYSDGSRSYMWQTGDTYKTSALNGENIDLNYHYINQ